jgi:two-component system LytT family response regulator
VVKKVLVVDDEKLARDRIARFISELGYPFQVIESDSGLSALEKINECHPDILFLDIQMPGLNGFELLQQLEHRPFKIIFQTAHDEYAIQAFNENASDYLLKPYTKDRFKAAVDKSLNSLQQDQRLKDLEKEFRKRDGYLSRISVRQGGKIHLVNVSEIHCLVSKDHYTCIYTGDAEFVSDLSLTHLEERLNADKFLRCHRNNIVCLEKIQKVGTGSNMTVQVACGLELPVSRQNRQVLLERIKS